MKTYVWLVRRELWENRAMWLLPAAVGLALWVLALLAGVNLHSGDLEPVQAHGSAVALLGSLGVGTVFFAIMSAYVSWYLLDCLYADRKDRSVLFWKSLPISDTATVLSKLSMALFIVPLIYLAAADLTLLVGALTVAWRTHASLQGFLWQPSVWLQLQGLWIYLALTTALWFLPIYAWALLVSAWAKRAVALWAFLVPLGICYAESSVLGTHYVAQWLAYRFVGFSQAAFKDGGWTDSLRQLESGQTAPSHGAWVHDLPQSLWGSLAPQQFFMSVALWQGVALGGAMLIGAIALRRFRSEA